MPQPAVASRHPPPWSCSPNLEPPARVAPRKVRSQRSRWFTGPPGQAPRREWMHPGRWTVKQLLKQHMDSLAGPGQPCACHAEFVTNDSASASLPIQFTCSQNVNDSGRAVCLPHSHQPGLSSGEGEQRQLGGPQTPPLLSLVHTS